MYFWTLLSFDQTITEIIRTPYPDWNHYQLFITTFGNALTVIVVFLLVLKISKYVSLSSISTALIVLCITPFLAVSITAKLCMLIAVILLVYRHKDNIKRIKNHTESKIQWM